MFTASCDKTAKMWDLNSNQAIQIAQVRRPQPAANPLSRRNVQPDPPAWVDRPECTGSPLPRRRNTSVTRVLAVTSASQVVVCCVPLCMEMRAAQHEELVTINLPEMSVTGGP